MKINKYNSRTRNQPNEYFVFLFFAISFIVLFIMGWVLFLLVIESIPEENLNAIQGTWRAFAIFGIYWLCVLLWCGFSSVRLTKVYFNLK